MKEIPNTLFSEQEIKNLISKVKLDSKQKNAAKEWKTRLDDGRIKIESQHEKEFADTILIDLLGFPDTGQGLEQKVKYMDYSVPPVHPNKGIVIELKSRGKNLFKEQLAYKNRPGKHTPVEQTIFYMRENIDYNYGICTNYEEFILFTMGNFDKCYRFKFPKKGEKFTEEKIQEFVAIFSKKNIDDGWIEDLIHDTIIEQNTLTNDFYQLYHETRLMLIKSFEENEKEQISKDDAIKFAQMFLNRLIFIFFAEDNDIITSNVFSREIEEILEKVDLKDSTTNISTQIRTVFKWMDDGSPEIDHILGFNGELFQKPLTRDAYFYDLQKPKFFQSIQKQTKYKIKPELNEEHKKLVARFKGQLNPIIENMLIMDNYDFTSQINVHILGHIFEHSIGDLEKLSGKSISKRKRDGVFYTPEYITKYICMNTIIPHLSKKETTDPHELIEEYRDNIEELERKIKTIKILDPSCGSGAFLVQAVDILIDLHDEIQIFKKSEGKYLVAKKGKKSGITEYESFDKGIDEIQLRHIIQDNIYGVDKNPESIEITKLSLFLKIASKNKRLIGLSERIKAGNSLISDANIVEDEFDWETQFLEIFDKKVGIGGFDVVIGNPPYFNIDRLGMKSKYAQGVKDSFPEIWMDKSDILFYFIAKSIALSKDRIGMIVSNAFLFSEKAEKLRNYILETAPIERIVNFPRFYVFDDADITTAITIFDKNKKDHQSKFLVLPEPEYTDEEASELMHDFSLYQNVNLKKDSVFPLIIQKVELLNNKIDQAGTEIGTLFHVGSGMQTGENDVFIFDENPSQFPSRYVKKLITDEIIYKFHISKDPKFCLYVEDTEKFTDLPQEIQSYLTKNKKSLEDRADKKRRKSSKWWNFTFPLHKDYYDFDKLWCSHKNWDNRFTYDNSKDVIGLTSTTVIFGTNKKLSLKYLCALLHSKLLNFRYQSLGKITAGRKYEYFDNQISKISIPEIGEEEQVPFIEINDSMIELYKDYFEKINQFLRRIKQNFGLQKISKKLAKFYLLNFQEFYDELMKCKIKLEYDDQNLWEDRFEKITDNISQISNKIENQQLELDKLVYKLYKITEKERIIIDKNYYHYIPS